MLPIEPLRQVAYTEHSEVYASTKILEQSKDGLKVLPIKLLGQVAYTERGEVYAIPFDCAMNYSKISRSCQVFFWVGRKTSFACPHCHPPRASEGSSGGGSVLSLLL